MMMRTRGFTLIDLMVVIVSGAILITISACMTRYHGDTRGQCTANLNGIGKGIAMYMAEDVNAKFPLLWTTGQPEADIEWNDSARDIETLKAKLVGREAAMQNMWLLIDKDYLAENAFGCRSDRDYMSREFTSKADRQENKVGWRSSFQFSYGLHFPYKSTVVNGEKVDNPAYLGSQLKGSFVIMADKNPSQNDEPARGVGPSREPSNHWSRTVGEAYLAYGGQVGWKRGGAGSKVNDDDIYTIQTQNNANLATPANINDTYIVRHPVESIPPTN
ncbi:MAG: hypothetical protein QGG42_12160 [Phycisphaerae bacterium]|nr:hypothetical protein [Phycisphaerae bacterium]